MQCGIGVFSAVTVSMSKPGCATRGGADEGFFSGVKALVGFELAALGERLGALWVVTLVGPLACVRAEVGLQALLSGEHSVADVALDAAGGLGALDDQSVDDVCSRAASP